MGTIYENIRISKGLKLKNHKLIKTKNEQKKLIRLKLEKWSYMDQQWKKANL